MQLNLTRELALLNKMKLGELKDKFAQVFGESTNSNNRTWLIRRIVWRLQANAEKLVRIRPIEETSGNDPLAIVARIEIRAAQADIAGALAELAKLPGFLASSP